MIITIKKNASNVKVEKLLLKLNKPNKNIGLRKFFGKFPIKGDALEIQKKLRDEWN